MEQNTDRTPMPTDAGAVTEQSAQVEARITEVAARILKKYRAAFEELAK